MEWRLWLGDALVLAGCGALTLTLAGVLRMPDAFAKLHAMAVAPVLGAGSVLLGVLPSCGWDVAGRALLVMIFLLATAPAASHALARLERSRRTHAVADDGRGPGQDAP